MKIAVKRPILTTMVILVVIVFGAMSILNLKLDMFPNMNIPVAAVYTKYEGAAPEEVEKLITIPLEGVLGTVSGIKNISSTSSNGSSLITLEFEDNTNIEYAALDMREKVDMIKDFLPEAAESPMVLKVNINSLVTFDLGITASDLDIVELKRLVDDKIVKRFERQDGVASVSVSGGKDKEVTLVFDPEKLRMYGISENQVGQILMGENRNTPAGTIKQGDKSLSLRVIGEFESLEEIADLPVTTPRGAIIYIRDIAKVNYSYLEDKSRTYINGENSVTLSIQKQSTANTVNVSDAILKEMEKVKAEYPNLRLNTITDPADFIRFTLNTVTSSATLGGLLAVIVLFVFLRSLRTTLIVGAAMPISIIATFALMYYSKITLNVMSMGGLSLGIGMLVDNSIVVLESIFRKLEEGLDRITAAIEGTREVVTSVTASTLTTIIVFLPITFSGGLTAQIFNELSLTIAFSLLSSLGVSLTFVPMLASVSLNPERIQAQAEKMKRSLNPIHIILNLFNIFFTGLEKLYRSLLGFCLRHQFISIAVVAAFIALTYSSLNYVGQEFMPLTDESGVDISIRMPKGTILDETERVAFQAADLILQGQYPEIEDVFITVGSGSGILSTGSSTDTASLTINLVGKALRERSSDQIARLMETELKTIPGADISTNPAASSLGMYQSGNIQLNVKGDDSEILEGIANDIKALAATVPGARDVRTSIDNASPQATIKIDRSKASSYGISAANIAGIINTAISGNVVTTIKENGEEIDLRIRQDRNQVNYLNDIETLLIPSQNAIVPLYELADIQVSYMPVSILRENSERYVSVTAALDGQDTNTVSAGIEEKLKDYKLPPGYSYEFSGSVQQMLETFSNLGFVMIISLLLIYMIMAAEFESLVYPIIVMFSIPVALTGGLTGVLILGQSLTITSFLGLIMLAGVVINNAIVLIDYTNLLRREQQMDIIEALKTAGPVRLRPILMSTLTTVLALIPMLYTKSEGSELMEGLATSVVFGLSFSTFVTLLLIPVIYLLFNNVAQWFRTKR